MLKRSDVLVHVTRGDLVECVHRGSVAVVDTEGRIVYAAGDPWMVTYMRSACKPIQAMALVESGAVDAFGLTTEELAVTCGSHSGQAEHVAAVQSILKKSGASEAALTCGVHPPFDQASRVALIQSGQEPSSVHCNCSGKHAGMLAVCRQMGWDLEGYRFLDHPLQQYLLKLVADLCGVTASSIYTAPDGCGVIVHGMPIAHMAYAFARLATGEAVPATHQDAVTRVTNAMHEHPLMVAGTGRLCTELNGLSEGRFISKSGADGIYCAGSRELGLGVAVKSDEGNGRIAGMITVEVLAQLGAFTEEDLTALHGYYRPTNRNLMGDEVGVSQPVLHLQPMHLTLQ